MQLLWSMSQNQVRFLNQHCIFHGFYLTLSWEYLASQSEDNATSVFEESIWCDFETDFKIEKSSFTKVLIISSILCNPILVLSQARMKPSQYIPQPLCEQMSKNTAAVILLISATPKAWKFQFNHHFSPSELVYLK